MNKKNEYININGNLVGEVTTLVFRNDDEDVSVCNFTLVKKYGDGKEYINCSVYGKKTEITKEFNKGDYIHVFGYFNQRVKDDKTYKNFIVKSLNKIEKKEKKEEK